MKKYTKPYLLVESFQLDAAIAGSCTEKSEGKGVAIHYGQNSCVYYDAAGDIYFGNNCGIGNLLDPEEGAVCYQVMTIDVSNLYIGS